MISLIQRHGCDFAKFFLFAFAALSFDVSLANAENENTYFVGECNMLLEKLSQGELEEYLVANTNSHEAMVKLLVDYHIIFNPDFAKALLPALAAKGIKFENVSGTQAQRLSELKKVIQLATDEIEDLSMGVIANIQTLKAQLTVWRGDNDARVESLRTQRLFKAIEGRPEAKKIFQEVLERVVKSAMIEIAIEEYDHLVWQHSNRSASSGDRMFPYVFVGAAIVGGLTASGAYTNDLYSQFRDPLIAYVLTGVASGFATMLTSVRVVDHLNNRKMRKLDQDFSEFDRNYSIFVASGPASEKIRNKYDKLLKELETVSTSGSESVNSFCQLPICKKSPIDIAYLGHVDLLDIQAKEIAIKDAMNTEKNLKGRELSMQFARELVASPLSMSLQLKFRRELDRWLNEVEAASFARKALSQDLKKRISFSGDGLRKIRSNVYKERLGKATDEDLRKYEFLAAKLTGDLAALAEIESNNNKIEAWGLALEGRVQRIREILDELPKDESGWRDHVLKILEELENWER